MKERGTILETATKADQILKEVFEKKILGQLRNPLNIYIYIYI